jgi:hypothetical protein
MTTYKPDRWVVISGTTDDGTLRRRVLAGWTGGYIDSDTWRMSSGIVTTIEYDDRYEFDNESGSRYICYKGRDGFTGLSAAIFNKLSSLDWEIVNDFT